jgi:hypothetical protein
MQKERRNERTTKITKIVKSLNAWTLGWGGAMCEPYQHNHVW